MVPHISCAQERTDSTSTRVTAWNPCPFMSNAMTRRRTFGWLRCVSKAAAVRAHQEVTRRWWRRRAAFEVFASPLVVEEAGRGDVVARAKRQRLLRNLSLLEVTDDTRAVARRLLAGGRCPPKLKATHCTSA